MSTSRNEILDDVISRIEDAKERCADECDNSDHPAIQQVHRIHQTAFMEALSVVERARDPEDRAPDGGVRAHRIILNFIAATAARVNETSHEDLGFAGGEASRLDLVWFFMKLRQDILNDIAFRQSQAVH